jgi:plasmid stabilization system protein ParE
MPDKFRLYIEPEAFNDIQDTVDYYKSINQKLALRFFQALNKQFFTLQKNHSSFAIRYDNIRCIPLKKFPYMIHYSVLSDEKTVRINAVFCTYQNPENWHKRKKQ